MTKLIYDAKIIDLYRFTDARRAIKKMINTKEKINEYVELEKSQRKIMEQLSLGDALDLFFALTEQGLSQ